MSFQARSTIRRDQAAAPATLRTAAAARALADLARASLFGGAIWQTASAGLVSAWEMWLTAATALAVRLIRPRPLAEAAFVLLLAADVWLTVLGAFDRFNHGDHAGHLLLSAAVTVALAEPIARRVRARRVGERRRPLVVGAVAAAATVSLGVGWEIVEALSDVVLGTNMSLGLGDSLLDLAGDGIGALLGAAIAVAIEPRQA